MTQTKTASRSDDALRALPADLHVDIDEDNMAVVVTHDEQSARRIFDIVRTATGKSMTYKRGGRIDETAVIHVYEGSGIKLIDTRLTRSRA